jgi:hypothetical protein
MIEFNCEKCQHRLSTKEEFAGKRVKCLYCGEPVTVPGTPVGGDLPYAMAPAEQIQPAGQQQGDFANLRDDRPYSQQVSESGAGSGEGNPIIGWIIFILIFGVGNLILYATTGIFIIPLPRR